MTDTSQPKCLLQHSLCNRTLAITLSPLRLSGTKDSPGLTALLFQPQLHPQSWTEGLQPVFWKLGSGAHSCIKGGDERGETKGGRMKGIKVALTLRDWSIRQKRWPFQRPVSGLTLSFTQPRLDRKDLIEQGELICVQPRLVSLPWQHRGAGYLIGNFHLPDYCLITPRNESGVSESEGCTVLKRRISYFHLNAAAHLLARNSWFVDFEMK